MSFAAGQCWTYRAPAGFESSRLVIGAVVTFSNDERILCCSVQGAPRRRADGALEAVSIPFLPLSVAAFAASVIACDGNAAPSEHFAAALAAWQEDARGLSYFTVPFDGFLDRIIAHQMAAIVGESAA